MTAPIGPTDPLSLAALDVTLQASGLDTVLGAFQAVDEAGAATAAKEVGTIPFTTPGASEAAAAIGTATALLDRLGITAKAAADGVGAVVVADRELGNANAILSASGLGVEAVTKAQALALEQEAAAAREAAAALAAMRAAGAGAGGGALPPAGGGPRAPAAGGAEEDAAVAETTSLYGGLTAQLLELVAAYEAYRAIRDAVVAGGQFDATIESARLGIAAITQAYGTLTDAQGETLHGQDALRAAFDIADNQLQKLQADAVRVAVPFAALADLFRGIEGAGLKAGASLDQLREITAQAALTAQVLGTPYEQLNTTLVQLLEGHVRITNQLLAHLGLVPQIVHEWQQQGTLVENILATFQKFNGVAGEVQGTMRGISTEMKNAFDIMAGATVRPAMTAIEDGLRGALGAVVDVTTGRIQPALSGLVGAIGADLAAVARLFGEAFAGAIDMAKELSSWIDRNQQSVTAIIGGIVALGEEMGVVVKGALSLIGAIEGVNIQSGLVLVPFKMMGLAIAGAIDLVHGLEAALSGAGFVFMNLILTPLDLFNEGLGKALNFIHAGLGDGLIEAGKDGEAALQRIAGPALQFIHDIQSGNTAVEQFGRTWDKASADAQTAMDKVRAAMAGAVKDVATLKLTPGATEGGDGKDAVANAAAAAQIIGAAVDEQKAKLKAALDQGEISYKQYFDALTTVEIASLDAQIRAKQAALAAAQKPEDKTKAQGEIAKLEEQEQAVRIKNAEALRQKEQENTDALIKDDERLRAAHGDTYQAELEAINKVIAAHDLEMRKAGASDAERQASDEALRSALTAQLTIEQDLQRAEEGLNGLRRERATLESAVRAGLVPEQQAEAQLAAIEAARLPGLKQLAEQGLALAKALGDPKLIAEMEALLDKIDKITNQGAALGKLKEDWDRTMAELLASGTATAEAIAKKLKAAVSGQDLTQAMVTYADRLKAAGAQVDEQFRALGLNLGLAIANGIVQGATTKGGNFLGNIGKSIVAGMGTVFEQVGEGLIQYGLIMSGLAPFLSNPFTAGPAALAAGIALATLGKVMEAAFQGGSGGSAAAAGIGNAQTITIALPGGVGLGGSPIPGAQPPAVPPGARPVPLLPSGSLTVASAISAPQANLPSSSASLGTSGPPITVNITTLGKWSPDMQAQVARELRLVLRRQLLPEITAGKFHPSKSAHPFTVIKL